MYEKNPLVSELFEISLDRWKHYIKPLLREATINPSLRQASREHSIKHLLHEATIKRLYQITCTGRTRIQPVDLLREVSFLRQAEAWH